MKKNRKPFTCRTDEELQEYFVNLKEKQKRHKENLAQKARKKRDKEFNEFYKLLLWH